MSDSRREFIKKSAIVVGGTGLVAAASKASYSVFNSIAPSDTVNVALIGCNFMGFPVLQKHLAVPGVRCVALCDIDNNILEKKAKIIEEEYQQKPLLYNDFRKMLENKDIDAVIVSTPDHWHCLAMVYACQAGKDVYVEKPMANTIEECNVMVKAAHKYNRVVQVGQQQRSGEQWQTIMKRIHSGDLGKLRKVEIWSNWDYGVGLKKVADQPVPAGVDYNMWLGPAPLQKTFNQNRFHGYWRMFWDYGGGLMTDWGVHLLDMALLAGNVTSAPKTVMAYGDNLSFKDHARQTFDTMSVIFPQKDYVISYEQTAGTQNGPYDMNYGLRFVCDNASIVASRYGYKILPEYDEETKADKAEKFVLDKFRENHDLHAKNFIECIKDRSETICPPEAGRQVAMYAHMANIAVRSGENMLVWDDDQNKFLNSETANSFVVPKYRAPWELPKI
ncbi:Gfo/Idh/MocA family oxidoreductase [uncultured Draconibacterium sp.]|uniref:Gfo/Idh/MocA family protein n=1 Tax=uncultured Draconibacterium sp. TaxID=1573823 RepID=UPI003216647C